ncbi:GTP-binding protein [Cyclonatronum proteinivorum]|uniref:GTPase Der n=1 Tax=Cyclonatronum proteinivorum TaxID=1457365 RepID=A0A345ULZ0_9BACT|nr:ribosome biogenesis GTPase Der [Cyclonatronum proteinivorum]AXJ01492.1 GTP-binding protein [Cyclonatronum proteinivorum]
MLPVVSIVGRPNVGKSTLFNRLIGQRRAIVHDFSGVTRDRHYGNSFWNDTDFTVIDTGGYVPQDEDVFLTAIREQVHLAMDESDAILFVVDVETGITDLDNAMAQILRAQKKPVYLVVNKADNEERRWNTAEFYSLGFDQLFPVSSVNGSGTGDLLDALVRDLPEPTPVADDTYPKLAIIGRPNVGKSSYVNALLNHDRSIVTDVAGTTRDTINSTYEYEGRKYLLMDTAGLRKRTKVKENIEFYSTVRTMRSLMECDVAILLIDATQGLEAQDVRVLAEAERFNKGIIMVINKWDLLEKESNTFRDYVKEIREKVRMLSYVPVVSISALNRKRIYDVLPLVDRVLENRKRKISTSQLNQFLEQIKIERPLPYVRGHQLKMNYATQVKQNPPVFAFFMNKPKELPVNYRRYIENKIRDTFDFEGVPITMVFKEK